MLLIIKQITGINMLYYSTANEYLDCFRIPTVMRLTSRYPSTHKHSVQLFHNKIGLTSNGFLQSPALYGWSY